MGRVKREYQADFYATCEAVRDPASRREKAEKIKYALGRYARRPLGSAVCLDIGCSSGTIASAVASLSDNVLGLEYDRIALQAVDPSDRAKVRFLRGDAMYLPLGDNVVDIIICAQVYEHVPDAEMMVREMHRVLIPGGLVFFSGPNWLFPIEPHYYLPFLHWLPGRLADRYLRLVGKGDHYYERLRHLWALRRLLGCFEGRDITVEVMQKFHLPRARMLRAAVQAVPIPMWKLLLPFFPNYNWILYG
jgi:SAM-dependent methyltransferase